MKARIRMRLFREVPQFPSQHPLTRSKQSLNRGAGTEASDQHGKCALFHAMQNRDETAILLLLEGGASVDVIDSEGNNLLHIALAHHFDRLLLVAIAKGVNPNTINAAGDSPLHVAAKYRDYQTLHTMLEAKADLLLRDKEGNTALHLCAKRDHWLEVSDLTNAGVPVDAKNHQGITALQACIRSPMQNWHRKVRVILYLLKAGAKPTLADAQGKIHTAKTNVGFVHYFIHHAKRHAQAFDRDHFFRYFAPLNFWEGSRSGRFIPEPYLPTPLPKNGCIEYTRTPKPTKLHADEQKSTDSEDPTNASNGEAFELHGFCNIL